MSTRSGIPQTWNSARTFPMGANSITPSVKDYITNWPQFDELKGVCQGISMSRWTCPIYLFWTSCFHIPQAASIRTSTVAGSRYSACRNCCTSCTKYSSNDYRSYSCGPAISFVSRLLDIMTSPPINLRGHIGRPSTTMGDENCRNQEEDPAVLHFERNLWLR